MPLAKLHSVHWLSAKAVKHKGGSDLRHHKFRGMLNNVIGHGGSGMCKKSEEEMGTDGRSTKISEILVS